MLNKNSLTCLTCKYYKPIDDSRGHCINERLSDIERKYLDSIQPDRRYYPRVIFQVCVSFGCVNYHHKLRKDEQ